MEDEADGELATAEVWLMEGLAFAGAALEHVEVFAGGLVGGGFRATVFDAGVEEVKVGADEVANVFEKEGGALLAVFIDVDSFFAGAALGDEGGVWLGGLFADLVASDVGEPNGVENGDLVDDPAELGFPVDGFENAPGRGRGDDVVGDTFDFHLRAGEEGVVA